MKIQGEELGFYYPHRCIPMSKFLKKQIFATDGNHRSTENSMPIYSCVSIG